MTVDAFNAGSTAVPGPQSDESWDGWLWHRYFRLTSAGAIAGGAATDEDIAGIMGASLRVEVDSKAMRKVKDEEIVIAVVEVAEIGVATMWFQFITRGLFKLA